MPDPRRSGRRALVRSDLPETFTPESIRDLDLWTLRRLSRQGNGVLTPEEQPAFDAALREVMQDSAVRLRRPARFDHARAEALDPELRRSYQRTRARLASQADRARSSFPQLAPELATAETAPQEPVDEPSSELS